MIHLSVATRRKLVYEFLLFTNALRKGQTIAQPAIGDWVDVATTHRGTPYLRACVLGTVALGGMTDREVEKTKTSRDSTNIRKMAKVLKEQYPTLGYTNFFVLKKCPHPGCLDFSPTGLSPCKPMLFGLVQHLVDEHEWTRRRVLNFVRQLVTEAEYAE